MAAFPSLLGRVSLAGNLGGERRPSPGFQRPLELPRGSPVKLTCYHRMRFENHLPYTVLEGVGRSAVRVKDNDAFRRGGNNRRNCGGAI